MESKRFVVGDEVLVTGPSNIGALPEHMGKAVRVMKVDYEDEGATYLVTRIHHDPSTPHSIWYPASSIGPIEPDEPAVPPNPKQLYGDKKVPLHLNPPTALVYMAVGIREGAEKYGAWNFRTSKVEVMTYIGAIQRHLAAFVDGYDMDTDCKYPKPHLAGAIASLAILIDALEIKNAVDNRPVRGNSQELLEEYKLP